jgi:hypothetical protein
MDVLETCMKPEAATQTAQEFMESYLREKAELMKTDNKMRGAFEEKFYSEAIMKYIYPSRERTLEMNRDMLLAVAVDGDEAKAVTTKPPVGSDEIQPMQRYHLRRAGKRWRIFCTESTCMNCNGSGRIPKGSCAICGGTGWKDYARERFNK